MNNAFGEQKTSRQFLIVARCAHGDRHAAATHTDFQRFFARKQILRSLRLSAQMTLQNLR